MLLPLSNKTPDRPSQDEPTPLTRLDGVTALIVEDDDDTRELVKRMLTDAGASVVEVASAAAALAVIDATDANVLVSDIGMAAQNGYDLLRVLRARGYDAARLPALALTAFARNEDRAEALRSGFQDHLIKPFDPQVLVNRLASLCQRAVDGGLRRQQ